MKLLTQKIDTCCHCPYCWADVECVKLDRVFRDVEEKISQKGVQEWCPLPDEKEKSDAFKDS